MLLIFFVIPHAVENLHVSPELRDFNGYEYYYAPSVVEKGAASS